MATDNFILTETAILNGGRMDESGKRSITKRFIYKIVDNSEEKRKRAVLDLETLVPLKGSCMSDDARYIMKTAEWNCLDWEKESDRFYIDATYQRASDDEYKTEPWRLAPFNVSFDTVEETIGFSMAYNRRRIENGRPGDPVKTSSDNVRNVPVVNSAGDPIEANTSETFSQVSFSYYVEKEDAFDLLDFQNSVNATAEKLFGHSFPIGTLLIAAISTEGLVTYQDDGYTVKWKYSQVNVTARYNPDGWWRRQLDVGNRAKFGTSTKSELIYQYYAPIYDGSTVTFDEVPTLTNAQGYYTANREYREWLAGNEDASNCPAQLPYEYAENIPLASDGTIDLDALAGTTPYPENEYRDCKVMTWSTLSFPTDAKRRWR